LVAGACLAVRRRRWGDSGIERLADAEAVFAGAAGAQVRMG
jgi:hypothetical protein